MILLVYEGKKKTRTNRAGVGVVRDRAALLEATCTW